MAEKAGYRWVDVTILVKFLLRHYARNGKVGSNRAGSQNLFNMMPSGNPLAVVDVSLGEQSHFLRAIPDEVRRPPAVVTRSPN
jgi:hypothetical protein